MAKSKSSPSPRWEGYESPIIQVVEIHPEGVLCQSGKFEQWNEETLDW